MANGMSDTFAPMRQAFQNYQNVLANMPALRGQRLQNQAKEMQIKNALREAQQQQQVQQYVQQQQQAAQTPKNANALQMALGPSGYEGMKEDLPKQEFQPFQAQLEAWAQVDPTKARELLKDEMKTVLEMSKINPDVASERAEQNLGFKMKAEGDDVTMTTPEGVKVTGSADSFIALEEWDAKTPDSTVEEKQRKAAELGLSFEVPGAEEKEPEPWETKTIESGDKIITKTYNPETKEWETASAPRWQDKGKGADSVEQKRKLDLYAKGADRILNDYKELKDTNVWAMIDNWEEGGISTEKDVKRTLDNAFTNMRNIAENGKTAAMRKKAKSDLQKLRNLRNKMNKILDIDLETEGAYSIDRNKVDTDDPLGLFK
ncbi:MAG: hypothetical protein KGY70_18285 [Bacteroidales bacterium]|nr:hypothetical protein [Bacteroidales bacterium]